MAEYNYANANEGQRDNCSLISAFGAVSSIKTVEYFFNRRLDIVFEGHNVGLREPESGRKYLIGVGDQPLVEKYMSDFYEGTGQENEYLTAFGLCQTLWCINGLYGRILEHEFDGEKHYIKDPAFGLSHFIGKGDPIMVKMYTDRMTEKLVPLHRRGLTSSLLIVVRKLFRWCLLGRIR